MSSHLTPDITEALDRLQAIPAGASDWDRLRASVLLLAAAKDLQDRREPCAGCLDLAERGSIGLGFIANHGQHPRSIAVVVDLIVPALVLVLTEVEAVTR